MVERQLSLHEELESMVECPIHYGVLDRPKSLPCGHVICEDCISQWVNARGGILVCPECNNEQILPPGGVASLPNCYRLNNLCDFLGNLTIVASRKEGNGDADGNEAVVIQPMMCPAHRDKQLDRICKPCKTPVCQECSRVSHMGHMCVDGETFMKHMDLPLKKLLRQARAKEVEIRKGVQRLAEMREELQHYRNTSLDAVETFTRKLIENIKTAEVVLKGTVKNMFEEKDEILNVQELEHRNVLDDIQSTIQILTGQSDNNQDVASLPPLVNDTMLQLEKICKISIQSGPKTSSTIEVVMSSDIIDLLDIGGPTKLGKVFTRTVPDPAECCLKPLCPTATIVGQDVRVELILNDGHGAVVKGEDSKIISAEIVTPRGRSVIQKFEKEKDAKFYTSFKPKLVGQYFLEGRVYNLLVKNSPLPLLVKPRGIRILEIKGAPKFTNPHDVIQSGDNYIILEADKIRVVDRIGRMVNKFLMEDIKTFQPYSIASHQQAYYVTALKGGEVVKFSAAGVILQRIGKSVLQAPTGVDVAQDGKIYVADDALGCIYVFGPDGSVIKKLSSPGNGSNEVMKPWFIKLNKKNQLVVADCSNRRIQIFDLETGKGVHSIYVKHKGKPMLCRGLDLDSSDNIFVTVRHPGQRRQLECVMVYSPDGSFISSFGENQFNLVRGIRIVGGKEDPVALVVDGNGDMSIKGYQI